MQQSCAHQPRQWFLLSERGCEGGERKRGGGGGGGERGEGHNYKGNFLFPVNKEEEKIK